MMASIGTQMPGATGDNTDDQWEWACTQDVHLHWAQAPINTPYSDYCPVTCGPYIVDACTPVSDDELALIQQQCDGYNAVYEITASGALGGYVGCFDRDNGGGAGNANVPGQFTSVNLY